MVRIRIQYRQQIQEENRDRLRAPVAPARKTQKASLMDETATKMDDPSAQLYFCTGTVSVCFLSRNLTVNCKQRMNQSETH